MQSTNVVMVYAELFERFVNFEYCIWLVKIESHTFSNWIEAPGKRIYHKYLLIHHRIQMWCEETFGGERYFSINTQHVHKCWMNKQAECSEEVKETEITETIHSLLWTYFTNQQSARFFCIYGFLSFLRYLSHTNTQAGECACIMSWGGKE